MSSVGIPIKLLYEAEGMKVTVEVSVRRVTKRIEFRSMWRMCWHTCMIHNILCISFSRLSTFAKSTPVQIINSRFELIGTYFGCM